MLTRLIEARTVAAFPLLPDLGSARCGAFFYAMLTPPEGWAQGCDLEETMHG